MTPTQRAIENLLNKLLRDAQTLRIQQVQATSEAGWSKELRKKSDDAWDRINMVHEALTLEIIPEMVSKGEVREAVRDPFGLSISNHSRLLLLGVFDEQDPKSLI